MRKKEANTIQMYSVINKNNPNLHKIQKKLKEFLNLAKTSYEPINKSRGQNRRTSVILRK